MEQKTTEKKAWKMNGLLALVVLIGAFLVVLGLMISNCVSFIASGGMSQYLIVPAISIIVLPILVVLLSGLTIIQPNEARTVLFFGKYEGIINESGLWYTIPLSVRKKVTLRVCNFNSNMLKVNDVDGNPVEIAAVVVFKVTNPTKATLDVEAYESFVEIQSETALRHVATRYPYDSMDGYAFSLRANAEEIAAELTRELQERLEVAGVEVLEARLTHLAYATEIASAMLQRQQATAILAARQKIVEGAVGMAQMAIAQLEADGTIELDDERKVTMINNLLIAIVSDRGAQPVINAGSIY